MRCKTNQIAINKTLDVGIDTGITLPSKFAKFVRNEAAIDGYASA